jgi:hypothetical protein
MRRYNDALSLSAPIAEGSLEQGKSRDRSGVGAQNARAKGQPDGARQSEQRLALASIEPAFRADENREFARIFAAAAGTQYLDGVCVRRVFIAKNEQAALVPGRKKRFEPHGGSDLRN